MTHRGKALRVVGEQPGRHILRSRPRNHGAGVLGHRRRRVTVRLVQGRRRHTASTPARHSAQWRSSLCSAGGAGGCAGIEKGRAVASAPGVPLRCLRELAGLAERAGMKQERSQASCGASSAHQAVHVVVVGGGVVLAVLDRAGHTRVVCERTRNRTKDVIVTGLAGARPRRGAVRVRAAVCSRVSKSWVWLIQASMSEPALRRGRVQQAGTKAVGRGMRRGRGAADEGGGVADGAAKKASTGGSHHASGHELDATAVREHGEMVVGADGSPVPDASGHHGCCCADRCARRRLAAGMSRQSRTRNSGLAPGAPLSR